MTPATRLALMELFRRDVTAIEGNDMPSFVNRPLVFKYQHHTFLFNVWLAGRVSVVLPPRCNEDDTDLLQMGFDDCLNTIEALNPGLAKE